MKKITLDDETEEDLRTGLSKGRRDDLSDADRAAINRYRPNSPPVKSASHNSGERVLSSDAGPTGGETSIWAQDCPRYPGCKCDDICIDSGGVSVTSGIRKSETP